MTVYKRADLTPEILRAWERDAKKEQILQSAKTLEDLQAKINEEYDGKIVFKKSGEILIDDCPFGLWRKKGDFYLWYFPPRS